MKKRFLALSMTFVIGFGTLISGCGMDGYSFVEVTTPDGDDIENGSFDFGEMCEKDTYKVKITKKSSFFRMEYILEGGSDVEGDPGGRANTCRSDGRRNEYADIR